MEEESEDTGPIKRIEISKLFLDPHNPRFGNPSGDLDQESLLKSIVEDFGVEDVISSIAVNGYIEAEPLVVAPLDGGFSVVEGNRRLAAMLLLSDDPRAADFDAYSKRFRKLHKQKGAPAFNPAPCILFEDANSKDLLSYLGVRHIVSTKDWDSYAKAIWINRVATSHDISIDDISLMIGDQNKTIGRLLEGYKFMKLLEDEGRYDASEQSQRRGRGSNSAFPFSWVYTLLGYTQVREYLSISDDVLNGPIVPDDNLDEAEIVVRAMFGDKKQGKASSIDDSRQLGSLAKVFADADKVAQLESGLSVREIEEGSVPTGKYVASALVRIERDLTQIQSRLVSDPPKSRQLAGVMGRSKRVKNLAEEVHRKISEMSSSQDE